MIPPLSKRSNRSSSRPRDVARVTVTHQRMVMAPMEMRGGTASDDADRALHRCVCSQGAGPMRDMLAAIMGIDHARCA